MLAYTQFLLIEYICFEQHFWERIISTFSVYTATQNTHEIIIAMAPCIDNIACTKQKKAGTCDCKGYPSIKEYDWEKWLFFIGYN